jgi:formamidopyrimidine-DNA glycosylase
MPELPDLAVLKGYVDATALYQEIEGLPICNPAILENTSCRELEKALSQQAFQATDRHGKWLFLALSNARHLVFHFGMTGDLAYFKDWDQEPAYDRLLISFDNGYHLAYLSQRKLGEVRIIQEPEDFIAQKELGPDALSLSLDCFKERLADRRGMLKSTLMNQEILAGIGNVYADEILYQAGFHPRTRVSQLDADGLERLYYTMKEVLRAAIECQAEPEQFPARYLTRERHSEGVCPICKTELQRVNVSSRTAYFCPNCQGESGKANT